MTLAICDLLIRLVVDPFSVPSSIAVTAIQLESLSYSSSDSYTVVQELNLIRFAPFSLPRFPCSFHSQSGSFDYESILGHNLSYILHNYVQFKACGSCGSRNLGYLLCLSFHASFNITMITLLCPLTSISVNATVSSHSSYSPKDRSRFEASN